MISYVCKRPCLFNSLITSLRNEPGNNTGRNFNRILLSRTVPIKRTFTGSRTFAVGCNESIDTTIQQCNNSDRMATNQKLTEQNVKSFTDSFDTILTDCDGVLWNDTSIIDGAPLTIKMLKDMGKRVFYVTNNSTKSRKTYVEKLTKLGFPAQEDDVIGSAYVTANYIKTILKYTGKIYMIGSKGLTDEFDAVGLDHTGFGPDNMDTTDLTKAAGISNDPKVSCVVVGFDHHFNYAKMLKASSYLQKPGCHFIGTNCDSGLPMGPSIVLPGTGSILRAVEVASQRKATIMGKPTENIYKVTNELHKIDPAKTIMIGDRLDTDIALGHNCNLRTLHVHTGFNSKDDVAEKMNSSNLDDKKLIPHYYTESMKVWGELIKHAYK